MVRVVKSAPNFFKGSLHAFKEIPAFKIFEIPKAAEREFFLCNYPLIISFFGVFRGVELVCTIFIGSLCALNKIPALKSFEIPKAAEREFFLCNYPPIISFLWVFRGFE